MKLYCAGHTSASVGGREYHPGPDGAFDVPDALGGELIAHGFTRTAPVVEPEPVEPPAEQEPLSAEPMPKPRRRGR